MLSTSLQNTDNTKFTGITKKMKRCVFVDGKKDISEILKKRDPQKNTYVCELPPFIFYALPKENRPQIIKEFFQTFDETANEIRNYQPSAFSLSEEYKNRRTQSSVDKLKALFQKYNLLDDPDKFDIKYLGSGAYKKAFKLEGLKDKKTNEEFCFKIFHLVDKTPEWHKYKSHGNYAEINIDAYWRENEGMDTQRGKFYFGDINNGYFIDKYIDDKVSKPQKIVNEYDNGIKLTDEVKESFGHNKLYGYSIDPGGVRVVNRIKNQSKTARYVLKRIKNTPYAERGSEWYKILYTEKHIDDTQKKAGLALCIKHLHYTNQETYVKECLRFNKPLVDMAVGYALKYLPEEQSKKYFEILMHRKNPMTQTVLLNEIPLLSRVRLDKEKIDDLDVPRGEINTEKLQEYYKIAEKYVVPGAEEHLASYVHLLPKDRIIPEAEKLIAKNDYNINDRLLHKIKFVHESEFADRDKREILDKIEQTTDNDFIKDKIDKVRLKILRDGLED